MEPVAVQQNNIKGEKEHDKLLAQGDCSKEKCYGNVSCNKSPIEAQNSLDANSLTSSVAHRLSPTQKTSKDKYLKSLAEEDVPKATCKKKALKVVVTVLFIVIVVGVVAIWTFHEGRSKKHIGNEYFDFLPKKRVLNVHNDKDDIMFSGNIRVSEHDIGKLRNCYDTETKTDYCFIFDDDATFRFVTHNLGSDDSVHCADIIWENIKTVSHIAKDCFDINLGSWYGIPNLNGPFWPLQPDESSIDEISYRPYNKEILGHILENFWLSTNGIAIVSHQRIPLKISFNSGNDRQLCLAIDSSSLDSVPEQKFNYTICRGPNLKTTAIAVRKAYFSATPVIEYSKHDFSNIVWKFENKKHVTNTFYPFGVFLHKLNTVEIPIHMVQYDIDWEDHIGDIKFNVQTLNTLAHYLKGKYSGAKLLLPVTLSCSYLSENFKKGAMDNLFAKDPQTGALKAVLNQGQSCGIWDLSNPGTKQFLHSAFDHLQQKGTQEETTYPQSIEFQTIVSNKAFPLVLYKNTSEVNAINVEFTEFLQSLKKSVLIDTAYHMQSLSMFVEIPTRVANKDGKKCLDYAIPALLTAGLHGYPYVLTAAPSEEKVDQELFIRWLELAAFFPGLKITNAVEEFGDMALAIAKNVSQYRRDVIIPIFSKIVQYVSEGVPLVRPLWWVDSGNYITYNIADQFLIGETLLVAPVLCHGERQRDVYLPAGKWLHQKTGDIYNGRQWLRNVQINLQDIAIFELHTENENVTSESL